MSACGGLPVRVRRSLSGLQCLGQSRSMRAGCQVSGDGRPLAHAHCSPLCVADSLLSSARLARVSAGTCEKAGQGPAALLASCSRRLPDGKALGLCRCAAVAARLGACLRARPPLLALRGCLVPPVLPVLRVRQALRRVLLRRQPQRTQRVIRPGQVTSFWLCLC